MLEECSWNANFSPQTLHDSWTCMFTRYIFFHTALSWRKFLLTTLITKLEIYDRVESRHSFKIYIEKIVYIALRKMCFHSLYQRPTAGCAALLLKRLLLNKLALNKKKEKENSAVISFQQKVKYNQAMLLCTILE